MISYCLLSRVPLAPSPFMILQHAHFPTSRHIQFFYYHLRILSLMCSHIMPAINEKVAWFCVFEWGGGG